MKQPCGCCSGVESATPQSEVNLPGLPALSYRVGDYPTFFESMIARLSSLYIDVPSDSVQGANNRVYPLRQLTTREPNDFLIALLDAWAVVGDVLTFYQERIANEGFLLTAVERRSVVEIAKLVGYRLRPGVAASVYLAFTVTGGFQGVIPAGTRAQSVPAAGQKPQFYETSLDLPVRDTWNSIKPRLTKPQLITPPPVAVVAGKVIGLGTDADAIDSIYFAGTATNVMVGDPLLLVLGNTPGQQIIRFISSIDIQASQNRTEAVLVDEIPAPAKTVVGTLNVALDRFIASAPDVFAGSDLAAEVATILSNLLNNAASTDGPKTVIAVQRTIAQINTVQAVAVNRQFTRLSAWLEHLLDVLRVLVTELPPLQAGDVAFDAAFRPNQEISVPPPVILKAGAGSTSLGQLGKIIDSLNTAPSLQPANATRLARSVAQSFAPSADVVPRLLAALKPQASPLLYQAWNNTQRTPLEQEVLAIRIKTTLYASTYPGLPTYNASAGTTTYGTVSISNAWPDLLPPRINYSFSPLPVIALDAVYPQLAAGMWAIIDRPTVNANLAVTGRAASVHRITKVQVRSMNNAIGFSAKATFLTLDPPWLSDITGGDEFTATINAPAVIRGTLVYTQTDALALAEEPLDRDVEGASIELDGLYDGLQAGQWVMVSGERTDVPNVTGVSSSELVMITAVTQGVGKEACYATDLGFVPFTSVSYVTDKNAAGDRLVVGPVSPVFWQQLQLLEIPETAARIQFCNPTQLAPGFYANAYVPTTAERGGDFSDFQNLLFDPSTGEPLKKLNSGTFFAWRILNPVSSSETPHTTLTLANAGLAYTYNSQNVSIYGNVVKATQGQTTGEVLGNGDGSQVLQTFALRQPPLTYTAAAIPSGAESTLVMTVNEIEWHEAENLAAFQSNDRKYLTQTADSGQTSITFGDGVDHGARLPSGSGNVKATYRYGMGSAGNVDALQISQLATHPLGAQGVINPLAATGGADPDTLDQARRNVLLATLALDRLVSVSDYADFARTYAGIDKAASIKLSNGRQQVVHVTIAGKEDTHRRQLRPLSKSCNCAAKVWRSLSGCAGRAEERKADGDRCRRANPA